jgi:DNA-directed RNA polymerase specialized sigma24 family protein
VRRVADVHHPGLGDDDAQDEPADEELLLPVNGLAWMLAILVRVTASMQRPTPHERAQSDWKENDSCAGEPDGFEESVTRTLQDVGPESCAIYFLRLDGYDYAFIAQKTGRSRAACRYAVHRVKCHLRQRLSHVADGSCLS